MMKRIVVGISGASGFPLAVCLLNELNKVPDVETHLVYSYGAELTARQESGFAPEQIRALADVCYENYDIGAAIASGTFLTEGMIVMPCSMKTLSGIAHGYSENLLLRAADVTIKEQRKLILAVRETPLSPIHLENMLTLSRLHNVFIMPPVVTYYINQEERAAVPFASAEKTGLEKTGVGKTGAGKTEAEKNDAGKTGTQKSVSRSGTFDAPGDCFSSGGSMSRDLSAGTESDYSETVLSVKDMERHIVGKMLQPFGIEMEGFRRWK